jgi:hypothetical protein
MLTKVQNKLEFLSMARFFSITEGTFMGKLLWPMIQKKTAVIYIFL